MSTDHAAVPRSGNAARIRVRSCLAAFALVPASVIAVVLALTSESAGRCLTYGEGCSGNSAQPLLITLLGVVLAWAVALLTPARGAASHSVRIVAYRTQLGLECLTLLMIATYWV